MEFLKRIGGWLLALVLWIWAVVPKALDWVGRTTLPEDWEQLMAEKLPLWAAWLFSTPWWVPAILATALTAWVMWVSWPRDRREVSPARISEGQWSATAQAVNVAEVPASPPQIGEPEKRQWAKTSDYDLPIKLGVIDQLLDIIGANKDFELAAQESKTLIRNWEKRILDSGVNSYIDDLLARHKKCVGVIDKVVRIRAENERYEDIYTMIAATKSANIIPAMNKLLRALKALGPQPGTQFAFLIRPFVEDLEVAIKEFGNWRFEAEKALMMRRKELSS